jgi:hypothetical protein
MPVQQLAIIGRLQVPFLGERPNPAPHGIVGMATILDKTVASLSPSAVRNGSLGLLADVAVHASSPLQ